MLECRANDPKNRGLGVWFGDFLALGRMASEAKKHAVKQVQDSRTSAGENPLVFPWWNRIERTTMIAGAIRLYHRNAISILEKWM